MTQALEVHERLAQAVLDGRGVQALLAILCERLGVLARARRRERRVIGERHAGRALSFDGALELPVVAHGETAILKGGARARVASASTTGSCSTTARRRSRSSSRGGAPSRGRAPARRRPARGPRARPARRPRGPRRIAAFGLDPDRRYAALLAVPRDGASSSACARAVAGSSTPRRPLPLRRAPRPRRVPARGRGRGGGARARAGGRRGRAVGPRRRRPAGRGRALGRSLARGARRARRGRGPHRLVPRPRLARAPARPPGRGARGVRRPRARPVRANAGRSSSRCARCSTRAAAGARPPSGSGSTGTRSATGWSACASRPDAIPTAPRSGWSSGWR